MRLRAGAAPLLPAHPWGTPSRNQHIGSHRDAGAVSRLRAAFLARPPGAALLATPRRPGERAVAADVAAERRQRDEDLRRVGDEAVAAAEQLGFSAVLHTRPELTAHRIAELCDVALAAGG